MAEGKTKSRESGGGQFTLELVGFSAGDERPQIVVHVTDKKGAVVHSEKVAPDGTFRVPPDVLRNAQQISFAAADAEGTPIESTSVRYRASEFAEIAKDGRVALAEGIWSRLVFHFQCVSGSVKVCRRRPWWFDLVVAEAVAPALQLRSPFSTAAKSAALRVQPSLNDLVRWPYRCSPVCLGTVEVFRRTCCCWPIVIDDWRIPDLIRDLEILVERLPKWPPRPFPPPPPPPIDPLQTPIFKGGALNELAFNAASDLSVLRSMPREYAAQYINSRPYLVRKFCTCGAPKKVASGAIMPDGSFNICWAESLRLAVSNCHDEYAYVVKQTIGATTRTIYDGVTAGAWFHAGDFAELKSYDVNAFSCNETGPGDGTAYVYLDLIGDTESHELTTPSSTGWDRVAPPTSTSGLLFPDPTPGGHLRNLGGSIELTFNFSEGMKAPAVDARYYRVSISKADEDGNPTGPRYYYGQGLHPSGDGLTWQKAVITAGGVDIIPDTLGPSTVGGENYLYRIPYDSEADWTGTVRHHALIHTPNVLLDPGVPAGDASNHLITLEVFNAAGERLRPVGVPASGQPGTEIAKPFKFRRWFEDGDSVVDNTVEVPYAALTHLFCWDNRLPVANIERLVEDGIASAEECQFLEQPAESTFGVEYRAYVPDERFQLQHAISWVRGLNGSPANGGVGTLATPASPSNVGEPPDLPINSGTNTFEHMLTRIDAPGPPPVTTVLERCAFAVTLTTWSKTTDGENFGYPHASETAAFALQIEPEDEA